jgi:hypothetical protein
MPMLIRLSLCFAWLVLFVPATFAAPAPFLRPQKFWGTEVVFLTKTTARANAVLRLLSGAANRQSRLSSRMKIEVLNEGMFVRVWLPDCRERDGLVILKAVAREVLREPPPFMTPRQKAGWMAERRALLALAEEYKRRASRMRQWLGRPGGGFTNEDIAHVERTAADYDVQANPPTLHVAPRRCRTGRRD